MGRRNASGSEAPVALVGSAFFGSKRAPSGTRFWFRVVTSPRWRLATYAALTTVSNPTSCCPSVEKLWVIRGRPPVWVHPVTPDGENTEGTLARSDSDP